MIWASLIRDAASSLSACVFGGSYVSDPIELIERRIQAVLDGEKSTRGLHLFCQLGGKHEDSGITTLQISGSGWALVSWRLEDDTRMFSYQLPDEDMRRFYGMLMRFPFWSVSPSRRERQEDESNIHMRISDQEKGFSHGVQFFTGDYDDYPMLRDLMDRISKLVEVLSEGTITAAAG